MAASLGHSEVVILLLSRGADINGDDGAALKGAVKQEKQDMILLLLKRGASVDAGYLEALDVTAKAGRKDLVLLLLDRGVDVNTDEGSLMNKAFYMGWDEDIVLVLLKRYKYSRQRGVKYLDEAAALGYPTVVKHLVKKKVDVNGSTQHGSSLYATVLGRNPEVIETLINAGAEVNFSSSFGSPLSLAMVAQSRWDEGKGIVETLKKAGAVGELG
jgi:ankyrin repeat protein